jgi:hypothetical protein
VFGVGRINYKAVTPNKVLLIEQVPQVQPSGIVYGTVQRYHICAEEMARM